jgi:hypothetical protein
MIRIHKNKSIQQCDQYGGGSALTLITDLYSRFRTPELPKADVAGITVYLLKSIPVAGVPRSEDQGVIRS